MTQTLHRTYMHKIRKTHFEGVKVSELVECEKIFDVGVEVFEFDEIELEQPPALVCWRLCLHVAINDC